MKTKKQEYIELSFLYFKLRNLFEYGFMKYLFFKNLIGYVCDISDYALIRRVFEDLSRRNIFTIKQTEQHIYYCFNPYNKAIDETPDITVDWT